MLRNLRILFPTKSFKFGLTFINKTGLIRNFSNLSNITENKYNVSKIDYLRELPEYLEKEKFEDTNKIRISRKMEEIKNKNINYQKFFDVCKKLNFNSEFLQNFKITEKDIFTSNHQNEAKSFELTTESNEVSKLVSLINNQIKLSNLTEEDQETFNDNIKNLLNKIKSELKLNEALEAYKSLICFLKDLNNLSSVETIQEVANQYLLVILELKEIPLDVFKSNSNFVYQLVEILFYQRDAFARLINYENFNNNLMNILQNFIVTLNKYEGEMSADLAMVYYYLSFAQLKSRNFANAEEYALKSLEVFSQLGVRNLNIILPYYIISCISIEKQKDLKESYTLLKESFNLLKENKEVLSDQQEIVKLKILHSLANLCSLVEKDYTRAKFDVLEYSFNTINYEFVEKLDYLKPLVFDLLLKFGEINFEYGYYRVSFNSFKKALAFCSQQSEEYQNILSKLTSLYKYSDDFNSNLGSIFCKNANKSFIDENLNFHLNLISSSIKSSNFKQAKFFCDVIEKNVIKKQKELKFDDAFLLKFYSSAAIINKNLFELENSVIYFGKALALVYNSAEFNQNQITKLETLIKLHFNLAYVYLLLNQSGKVTESLENCTKYVKDLETKSLSKEELEKYHDLETLINFAVSNFYVSANETNKANLQLSKQLEVNKKYKSGHSRLKLISNYFDEVKKNMKN